MRKKIATVALCSTLGLAGGALLGPGLASAQTATPSPSASAGSGVTDRLTAIKDALAGLVSDGTIDQSQADAVASTLAEQLPFRGGRGGPRGGGGKVSPETVAGILGLTVEELRTQQQGGRTLAQIAEAEGVAKDTLIAELVEAAKARLAEAVTEGRLTQAQADERSATLEERITASVDRAGGLHGGKGHRGPRGGGSTSEAPATSTPSATSPNA